MLSDAELLEAFTNLESESVERKRNANDTDRIKELICALSNDMPGHNRPGVIFVGQEDDLSCSHLEVDDGLLTRLASLRDDGSIQPIPQVEVRKIELDGCVVAALIVAPSNNPPVRFSGRVWIRVGPRRAIATAQEERALIEKRQWGQLSFDAQSCLGSTLNDLDLARFEVEFLPAVIPPDVLVQNQRSRDQQLKTLRLVFRDGTPTNTGMLFLGMSPLTYLPGAYVLFRRVDGINLTDRTVSYHEISGTLQDQARQLDELLSVNVRRGAIVGGELREDNLDYPTEALRQLVRNALIHRTYEGTNAPVRITWYADRIEIQSPGGPYGQVTRENFGSGVTDYRNPTVAGLMVSLRLMERFGVGLQIAREKLAANNNPDMEFTIDQHNILVTVRPRS